MLTLSGSDTAANYQQALRTITYDNASNTPDTTTRVITFTPADAFSNGNTATTALTIAAVNDAPVNAVPGTQYTGQDEAHTFSTSGGNQIVVSDAELDGTTGLMELTLSVDTGTLTLNPFQVADPSAVQVNDTATGSESGGDVGYAADGSYVVVWTAADADFTGVYYERFDADGNSLSAETLVNLTTTDIQQDATDRGRGRRVVRRRLVEHEPGQGGRLRRLRADVRRFRNPDQRRDRGQHGDQRRPA